MIDEIGKMSVQFPTFNEAGFLSGSIDDWREKVRHEFAQSFALATRLNLLGMKILFDIPTENMESDAQALAVAAFGRLMQPFQTAILLAERGGMAESRTLVRLSCEAAIAIGALKEDATFADRLVEDHYHHRRALARSLLEGGDDGNPPEPDQIVRLQAILVEIEALYPKGLRAVVWKDAAKLAHLKLLFDRVYRLTSGDSAHLNLGSLNRHFRADAENQGIDQYIYRPEYRDLPASLDLAESTVLHGIGKIADWFGMAAYGDEIKKCVDVWTRLYDQNEPENNSL
jgi:hypothetical protein